MQELEFHIERLGNANAYRKTYDFLDRVIRYIWGDRTDKVHITLKITINSEEEDADHKYLTQLLVKLPGRVQYIRFLGREWATGSTDDQYLAILTRTSSTKGTELRRRPEYMICRICQKQLTWIVRHYMIKHGLSRMEAIRLVRFARKPKYAAGETLCFKCPLIITAIRQKFTIIRASTFFSYPTRLYYSYETVKHLFTVSSMGST
jgi:hypothetical protein